MTRLVDEPHPVRGEGGGIVEHERRVALPGIEEPAGLGVSIGRYRDIEVDDVVGRTSSERRPVGLGDHVVRRREHVEAALLRRIAKSVKRLEAGHG